MSDINVFISFYALKSNWTWCLERNAPSSEPMSHLQDDRLTVLITFRCDEKVIEKRMEESELNFTFSIKDLEAVIPSSNLWMFLTSDVLKISLNTLRVRAAFCSTSTIRASASDVYSHPSWPHDFQVFWFLIFWNKFLKNFAFKTQLFSIRLPVASNFLLMAATCEIVTVSYFHLFRTSASRWQISRVWGRLKTRSDLDSFALLLRTRLHLEFRPCLVGLPFMCLLFTLQFIGRQCWAAGCKSMLGMTQSRKWKKKRNQHAAVQDKVK